MLTRAVRGALAAAAVVVVTLATAASSRAQQCVPQSHTYTESFDDTQHMHANSSAGRWGQGEVTLESKYATFQSEQRMLGERVYTLAPGDFDGDGWKDMFALMLDPNCHIHYLRNRGMTGSPPEHAGFDMGGPIGSDGFDAWRIDSPAGCATQAPTMTSGDFDGDGDTDVILMRATNENRAGRLTYAYLYEFNGWMGNAPQFTRHNLMPDFNALGLAWHWTSTIVQSVDWDRDGRDDIIFGSSHGSTNEILLFKAKQSGLGFQPPVTLIADVGLYTPIADSNQSASGNSQCPPAVSRGINAVMVGDYDLDDDYDIIVGSTSEEDLKYWKNDGSDAFYQVDDIAFSEGAATLGLVGDFDGDGDDDIAVGRDGWNCNGTGGTLWLYTNDGAGQFTKKTTPIADGGQDLDFGAAFQIDNDPDDKTDIIVADGNNSGTYSLAISTEADIYVLESVALSDVVDPLSNPNDAVVSIKMTSLQASNDQPPENEIEFYVSNDAGNTWEKLLPDELPPNADAHHFKSFGSAFRWKAVLSSDEEQLPPEESFLAPGSTDTPHLQEVAFTYFKVDRRRYSRSGLSYGVVDDNGAERELIYSASFFYPGFQASVTAHDITNLNAAPSGNTGLQRVDNNANVSTLWDAGETLAATAWNQRTVYGAYAAASDGDNAADDRLELSSAELSSPSTNPSLQTLMGLNDSEKHDVLQFVLGDRGDPSGWKLYHIDHSTPTFVGAPQGDPYYLGNDYETFQSNNANRTPVVYVGANDGMLHAFEAATGEEMWAFVPHNLLSKLKIQRRFDESGDEDYVHSFFIDGPLVLEDVHDGNQWRTVLISGQGQGQGLHDNNYYFALDVTDPENPKPLWEFSDTSDYGGETCSGNPCSTTCEQQCEATTCSSSCTGSERLFVENGTRVVMEAEHFNTNNSVDAPHQWNQDSDPNASGGAYMTPQPDSEVNCRNDVDVCGAHMTYHFRLENQGDYYPFFRINAGNGKDDSVNWGIDGVHHQELHTNPDNNKWRWDRGDRIELGPGEYVFDVWMREDGQKLDKIVLKQGANPPSGLGPSEQCQETCQPGDCNEVCTTECVQSGEEWPECGVGHGEHCCPSNIPGEYFCAPLSQSCNTEPDPVLGETWSPPVVGRVRLTSGSRWVAFFASGYNNRGMVNVGRSIYAVDAVTGSPIARWDLDDIPQSADNPSTIPNTVPGGPNIVDLNNDGFVDRLYIGDLEGRLWKVDFSQAGSLGGNGLVSNSDWPSCVLFDAGDPDGDGKRTWAPIITKPGIAIIEGDMPNIYFGTGADDRAPDDVSYRFYAVRDTDPLGNCRNTPLRLSDLSLEELEWVVGDGKKNAPDPVSADPLEPPGDQEGSPGERYWSDPLIVDNAAVYFASLPGSIEAINPCLNLGGNSKVFGYAIRAYTTPQGVQVQPGESLFADPFLNATSKIRQAAIIRGPAQSEDVVHDSALREAEAKDVLIQEFSSGDGADERPAIRRLSHSGVAASDGYLRILRWREVPLFE